MQPLVSFEQESAFFRDTLRSLLKFPLKYPHDYVDEESNAGHKARGARRAPATIKLAIKALGRPDVLEVSSQPSMLVADLRKRVEKWGGVQEGDQMRMLVKGKAMSDDNAKVHAVVGDVAEGGEAVINVVIKKRQAAAIPDAFWSELTELLDKHGVDAELASKFRAFVNK